MKILYVIRENFSYLAKAEICVGGWGIILTIFLTSGKWFKTLYGFTRPEHEG